MSVSTGLDIGLFDQFIHVMQHSVMEYQGLGEAKYDPAGDSLEVSSIPTYMVINSQVNYMLYFCYNFSHIIGSRNSHWLASQSCNSEAFLT